MRNVLERSLPWLAAAGAPAVLVAGLYAFAGADAATGVAGGLVAGLVGILGALAAKIVRWHQERLDRETQLDEVLEILRADKQYPLHDAQRTKDEVADARIDAMIAALKRAHAEKTLPPGTHPEIVGIHAEKLRPPER